MAARRFCVPPRLTRRRSFPPFQSRGSATRCTTASTPARAAGSVSGASTSPVRSSTPAACVAGSRRRTVAPASGERTRATTRWPPPRSSGTTWLPTKPEAPVTRTVDMVGTSLGRSRPRHAHRLDVRPPLCGPLHCTFGAQAAVDGRVGTGSAAVGLGAPAACRRSAGLPPRARRPGGRARLPARRRPRPSRSAALPPAGPPPAPKSISKEGMTVFLSSHLLFEVEQICDHVTIINKGSVLASDTLQNVSSLISESPIIHIELVELSNAVIAAVKKLPFVSGTWKTGNTLLIQVSTRDDVRAQVSMAATGAGGVIVGMSQKESNLEDVFLQLITNDQGAKIK